MKSMLNSRPLSCVDQATMRYATVASGLAKVFGPPNFMVLAVMPSQRQEEFGTDPGVDERNFSRKFTGLGFTSIKMSQELQMFEDKGNLLTRDSHVSYKIFFQHSDLRQAFRDNNWLASPGLSIGRIQGASPAADADLVQVSWSRLS